VALHSITLRYPQSLLKWVSFPIVVNCLAPAQVKGILRIARSDFVALTFDLSGSRSAS
jgi:hypothetical protein